MRSSDEVQGFFPWAGRQFATTRWSVVLAAGRENAPQARAALAELCAAYWYPLYTFVRRQGYAAADAQDLTQGFFVKLLERNDLASVDPKRGRFRSFLLVSLKHYLLNERDRARAKKRGGGMVPLPIDFHDAENRFRKEPSHERTPDAAFEKQWALTLLDRVQAALQKEYADDGSAQVFQRLRPFLTGDDLGATYREIAKQLEMSEGAVKVAVHRLRRRFRQRLREEISETVGSDEQVDAEIRDLFHALRS